MASVTWLVDAVRMKLWFYELWALAGKFDPQDSIDPFRLAELLDPGAIWVDSYEVPRESKWSAYLRLEHLPSKALTERIRRRIPQLGFEFHHPVWYLLRNPALSSASVRRFVGQMPGPWRETLKLLDRVDVGALRIGGRLVETASLGRWTFLDAVLLFECLRRRAEERAEMKRIDVLIAVLYGLPFLYCDDVVWRLVAPQQSDAQREFGEEICNALDAGLELNGRRGREIRFPVDRRLLALRAQLGEVVEYKRKHPRALRDKRTYRNYLEEGLNSFTGPSSYLSKTAFRPAGRADPLDIECFTPPVDERLWVWASQTQTPRPWRSFTDAVEIDAVFRESYASKGEGR